MSNNVYFGLHRRILDKVKDLINILEKYSDTHPSAKRFVKEIEDLYDELKKKSEPIVPSRIYVETVLKIIKKLNSIEDILSVSGEELTLEDLRSLLRDLEELIYNYIAIIKREDLRLTILFRTPIYLALIIYTAVFIIRIVEGVNALYDSVLFAIGFLAFLVSFKRLSYSFALLLFASIYSVAILPLKPRDSLETYLILINMLILMSAISYFQLMRSVRSKTFRDKIKDLVKGFEELDKKIRESAGGKIERPDSRIARLEEEVLNSYIEIYGDYGRELFRYRLNVMLMHGMSKKDALNKMYEEIKKIREA